jgi:hypothetical protein
LKNGTKKLKSSHKKAPMEAFYSTKCFIRMRKENNELEQKTKTPHTNS